MMLNSENNKRESTNAITVMKSIVGIAARLSLNDNKLAVSLSRMFTQSFVSSRRIHTAS